MNKMVEEILNGTPIRQVIEFNVLREYWVQKNGEAVHTFKTQAELKAFLKDHDIPVEYADFNDECYANGVYKNSYKDWSVMCMPEIKMEAKEFKGSGKRINFDDDLVIIYDKDMNVVYKGLEDYDPMKDEDWKWDASIGAYRFGDYIQNCVS